MSARVLPGVHAKQSTGGFLSWGSRHFFDPSSFHREGAAVDGFKSWIDADAPN